MLVIRLSRVGKRNHPQFKVVVAEKSAPIKGRFVEQLESYNPQMKTATFNKERIQYWLSNGALCTDTTHNLFVKEGVIEGKKRSVKMKAKKKQKDPTSPEASDSAEATKDGSKDANAKVEDKKSKKDNKTMFIDASAEFVRGGNKNKLSETK